MSRLADLVADMEQFDSKNRLAAGSRALLRTEIAPFVKAVERLVLAARTSGGTAGRDEGLCGACAEVELFLQRSE